MPAPAGAPQGFTLMILGSLPSLAIAALVPVLPLLFAKFKDAPHKELLVPMILTVPSLCVALFSSAIGAAADFWGRRPVLILGLIALAVFGMAPMLFDGLYAIIASRFVVGLAEAAILTTGNALMGDYFAGDERKRWLGIQTSVGPFIGSAYIVTGGLLGNWSWRGPFLLYGMGLVVLVATLYTLHEPSRPEASQGLPGQPAASHFPWRETVLVGSVTLLVSVVYFLQAVQHGRIFSDLGVSTPARIGWIVTLASMGTVFGGLTYKTMRLRPISTMMSVAFTAYGIGYLGLSLVPNYIVGLPFDALSQFAGGFALPLLIAWALTKYDFEHRGRGMGIWAACFFLGQFLSPPLMTLIGRGNLSFLATVGVVGGACLLIATVAWYLGKSADALA